MCTSGNGTLERVGWKALGSMTLRLCLCRGSTEGVRVLLLFCSTCASELLSSFLSAWASHVLNGHFVFVSLAVVIVPFPEASTVTIARWMCNSKVILPAVLGFGSVTGFSKVLTRVSVFCRVRWQGMGAKASDPVSSVSWCRMQSWPEVWEQDVLSFSHLAMPA